MKYLSDYLESKQSQLFDEFGVFFAFGENQLKEGIDQNKHKLPEGDKFVSVGMGMIMPRTRIEQFEKKHALLVKEAIEQDLAENGHEGILARELMNYEIGYSHIDDPNFRGGIEGYHFTEDEVRTAYNKIMREVEW